MSMRPPQATAFSGASATSDPAWVNTAATVVIASSEAPVAVQAAAMLVIVGVLAASITFLARRSRRRSRARHDRYQQAITELPPEYRPDLRHRSLWVTGYVVTSAAVALVRNLVSGEAALVLAFVTCLPGTVVLVRIAATRNRRIRESVRSRMGQMDVATLIVLLDNLERVYGADMKPLRTLLPAGADSYRA
jgi:hypothetical protein